MIDEIVVCLDGSLFAEKIIPYARGIAGSTGAKLRFLRVVENERELAAAERYVEGFARHLKVEGKVKMAQADAVSAILEDLKEHPAAMPAITTHGKSGLLEMVAGSVALGVIWGAGKPVLLYRPPAGAPAQEADRETKISSVVAALDGSEFSEKILPQAVEIAGSLRAKLQLVQVLSLEEQSEIPVEVRRDVLETSYLRRKAEEIRRMYGIEADWDALHGEPAEALCSYIHGRQDVMLAMTSHARAGVERVIFGSVAGECVRRAGVLIMIYWPHP